MSKLQITQMSGWELSGHVTHWMERLAILAAFLVLFHVGFHTITYNFEISTGKPLGPDQINFDPHTGKSVSSDRSGIGIDIIFRGNEFSVLHQGLEFGIAAMLTGGAIKLRRVRNSNSRLACHVVELDSEMSCPAFQIDFPISGSRYSLRIKRVATKDDFKELIKLMGKAYPSALVSRLSKVDRWKLYYPWLISGAGYLAFVDRVDDKGYSERVGFMAACPIKHDPFCQWASGNSAGVDYKLNDLGSDVQDATFIDIKHWYIHRRKAPSEAMLWLLGNALRTIVRAGTAPVLFAQTVTDVAEANWHALGCASYGTSNFTRRPQFLLDGRREVCELSPSTEWTLKHLCGAEVWTDPVSGMQSYRRPSARGAVQTTT